MKSKDVLDNYFTNCQWIVRNVFGFRLIRQNLNDNLYKYKK